MVAEISPGVVSVAVLEGHHVGRDYRFNLRQIALREASLKLLDDPAYLGFRILVLRDQSRAEQ